LVSDMAWRLEIVTCTSAAEFAAMTAAGLTEQLDASCCIAGVGHNALYCLGAPLLLTSSCRAAAMDGRSKSGQSRD
jgi:hypothetical protein